MRIKTDTYEVEAETAYQIEDLLAIMNKQNLLMQQPTSVQATPPPPAPKPESPDDERWWTFDVAECRGGTHNTWRVKKSGGGRFWHNGEGNSESGIETWAEAESAPSLIELDPATGKPLEKK